MKMYFKMMIINLKHLPMSVKNRLLSLLGKQIIARLHLEQQVMATVDSLISMRDKFEDSEEKRHRRRNGGLVGYRPLHTRKMDKILNFEVCI